MKEKTKNIISDLINRFHRNKEIYKNPKYNETQLRREFLDPFFSALDWDVANKQGFSEQYKEVVHEDSVKISGTTKAPDYSFRIGGVRKFFVEAKKPAVDIKYDIHPSYQLRRYAWSAKLPISILTDFEEFSVYDCRIKPNQKDSASVARIYYQTYDNYLKDLEFIYNTFSKEAILKGSFDKYISTTTKKRGTSEVDKEFLKEIERWRDTLARNIALRNKALSIFEINFVVQLTIDRIIFLRIAEDRGVEDYRTLYKLAQKKDIYKNLFNIFRIADDKYNSGIFDFQKDKISPNINIDDKVLKSILLHLYYPESPYEFSVLPADILGNIYEQFLGKTIRLTPSHQAKVEEKPEVRKAGGVYYTPKYIVDYIVKNTVGEKIKGKTPRQISKITICDPACGSGSFLIQAYQYILDYHLEFYQKDLKKYKNKIIQIGENSYQLTTQEKKRILLSNIYGVDIDPQAVEVTKLSLLLKVLEGENRETLQSQLKLFHERALPNLSNNIKCGNSLIGTDYYDNVDMSLFKSDAMRKINAFDWEKEFPQIFHRGDAKHIEKYNKNKKLSDLCDSAVNTGFDVLIGNPPYVRPHNLSSEYKKYFWKNYKSFTAKSDIYAVFIEKSLCLLKRNSTLGFIVSSTWLGLESFTNLRDIILKNQIIAISKPLKKVFKDATVETILLFVERNSEKNKEFKVLDLHDNILFEIGKINQKTFIKTPYNIFDLSLKEQKITINKPTKPLSDFVDFYYGLKTGDDKKFISFNIIDENSKKLLRRRDFQRYCTNFKSEYVWYRPDLMKRHRSTARPGNNIRFENPKIMVMDISKSLIAQYDEDNYYVKDALLLHNKPNLQYNLKYILALLNSKLMTFLYSNSIYVLSVAKNAILRMPIIIIDFSNPSEKQIHDTLISLVDQMLSAQQQYHSAKIERDKKLYKQKIDILDRKIDWLVYELYGLSEKEIKIVEEKNKEDFK
ncbi:MAG: N-6 DNA methylase [Candidatus Cloacimonetes bacterium]|nr:N-6 DNA methylase [Candidatus Cloacimonadota bacterium]